MANMIKTDRVQNYLDKAIRFWRVKQLQAQTVEEQIKAVHYQDAFQTARATFLGSMLPVE